MPYPGCIYEEAQISTIPHELMQPCTSRILKSTSTDILPVRCMDGRQANPLRAGCVMDYDMPAGSDFVLTCLAVWSIMVPAMGRAFRYISKLLVPHPGQHYLPRTRAQASRLEDYFVSLQLLSI